MKPSYSKTIQNTRVEPLINKSDPYDTFLLNSLYGSEALRSSIGESYQVSPTEFPKTRNLRENHLGGEGVIHQILGNGVVFFLLPWAAFFAIAFVLTHWQNKWVYS